MRLASLAALAAAVALVAAAPLQPPPPDTPTVTLPAEARTPPGRVLKLAADTAGRQVRWALVSDDADLVPFPDGKVALFCAPKPGRYTVLAWTAAADVPSEAARCVVVVGDSPSPTPPSPADPLAADVRKLFADDPSPDKAGHLAQLAVLYREAVKYADAADVRTAGELAARIRTAASSLVPPGALVPVRKRVADEIAKHLPVDGDVPLDAGTRRTAAALFARVATALEVKP